MSFKEKNITVSLFSFVLILIIYLIGIWRMVQGGGLDSTSLFRLWGLMIVLAMLTFVFGQSPLFMFSLLILSGLVAQIAGDSWRLTLYQRGF